MHPCHSHKKGRLGLGLGMGVTDVTVRLDVVAEAAAAVADAAVVGLVEAADASPGEIHGGPRVRARQAADK